MKNSTLNLFNTKIHPGERLNLALPFPELFSCTALHMPIKVVHGKEAGPCVLIFAAVRDDELNGMEIINRLLQLKQFGHLRGTLIAVPVINIPGLFNQSKTLALAYETNLDNCFPGKPDGSYGERIAHVLTQELFIKADYCIELQTGSLNHDLLPQIYCNFAKSGNKDLAQCFGVPVITNIGDSQNSLQQTFEQLNIPHIIYKAGEAMRFDELAIQLGLLGVQSVMRHLDMWDLDETEKTPLIIDSIYSQDQEWLRAHFSGVLHSDLRLGQRIKNKQVLGYISDPFSADTGEQIKSTQDGVVVGINRNPLIHEGQTIFKIASFLDNSRAEIALEVWNDVVGLET